MDKRAVIVCLVLGVAACQPALKPDTGYPADWPAMTVLAPGFAELAGTALRFAGLLFFMSFLFWEFFTPFNQFGEPLPLIALELIFWAAIAVAEAFAIAVIIERRRSCA